MTIKMITKLTGKQERTIRRWANLIKDKMSGIKDKMSVSSPKKPADFSLDETIAIIRAGGNGVLADLLMENARQPLKNDELQKSLQVRQNVELSETIEMSMQKGISAGVEAGIKAVMPLIENMIDNKIKSIKPKMIGIETDYFEALGYSIRKDLKLNQSTLAIVGKECSKLSREKNIEIRKNPHSRYGTVNVYHKSILEQVFSDLF